MYMTRSDKIFQVWSLIATVLQLDYNLVTFFLSCTQLDMGGEGGGVMLLAVP